MNKHIPHLPLNFFSKALLFLFLIGMAGQPALQAQTLIASNGKSKYVVENDNESFQIEHEGKVTIGPDDKSITHISEGGFIKIRKKTFGNTRELFISNSGGRLQYEYKEGGRAKDFDPAGKSWLSDILPDLLRSTTIGAESRVDRLYQQGGAQAVLNEFPNLKSDYVRAGYAKLLLQKNIRNKEVPALISAIGQHIESDYYRYEVFKNNRNLLLSDPANLSNYLKAIETVKSDHYKTELVKLALENEIPKGQQRAVLQLIGSINSDHYRTEVIKKMIRNELSETELDFLLSSLVLELKSDHYRSEVIEEVLRHQGNMSAKNIDAVIRSIGNNRSDHYRKETLEDLMQYQQLSASNYETLYTLLGNFNSDHYKAEFMEMLVKDTDLTRHFELFLREINNMRSDHYRSEVLEESLRNTSLNEDQLVKLVQSVGTLGSEHYKAEFLQKVCRTNSQDKVKAAIRETAKTINSTYYYGEVMKCIE